MALTSIVSVLACPMSIRQYPEALELQQQSLMNPTLQPERLVAPTVGLDQFILTFLEAALRDESSEEQKDISSKENQTVFYSSNDEELRTNLIKARASLAKGQRRKEFFRFYKYEQYHKLMIGRNYSRFFQTVGMKTSSREESCRHRKQNLKWNLCIRWIMTRISFWGLALDRNTLYSRGSYV